MADTPGLVVIGASHAGHQIAIAARQAGYDQPITVLSAEDALPYQRPPLSKAYMMKKIGAEDLLFRPAGFYSEQGIDMKLGVSATRIDRQARCVHTGDGSVYAYDKLAIATGTRVRELPVPGADLGGVHYIRALRDIDEIASELDGIQHVTVIGGGFIGLEAAAALRLLGKAVAVIELADRLMARGVGSTVSGFFADYHRGHGVDLRLETGVAALEGNDGRVARVILSDGTVLATDMVIAGIGVLPNDALAAEAGIDCKDGILVDANGRTSDPDIFAAGDVARFESRFAPGSLRLESVQNATDQARAVGASVAGRDEPYTSAPWFWSDQYDLKLQMTGITAGYDREVVRGDPAASAFSVFYFRDGVWLGTDTVNQPSDHITSRRLLDLGYLLTVEQAADPSVSLKDLLKAARKKG